jgi:hypothetical protein
VRFANSGPVERPWVGSYYAIVSWRVRAGLMTGAALLAWTPGSAQADAPDRLRVGPVPTSVPVLRNAFALGTLVGLDTTGKVAEMRISCGWHYRPRRKVRPGVWKVDLSRLTFGWQANAHVDPVPLATWVRRVQQHGWSGSLRLRDGGGDLATGPTTDICAGIPG